MILFGFLFFGVLTLFAEWAIYRRYIRTRSASRRRGGNDMGWYGSGEGSGSRRGTHVSLHGTSRRRSPFKRLYIWITAGVWILTFAGIAGMRLGLLDSPAIMRVMEVVLLLFLFNGVTKLIFASLAWIGRRTGWNALFQTVAVVIIAAIAVVLLHAATVGRGKIRTEHVVVASDELPAAFDGFRVVVFSDAHLGSTLGRYGMMERMVDVINSLGADMVVNGGDIINNDYTEFDGRVRRTLAGIRSRHGVYSVIGNHDMGIYRGDTVSMTTAENAERLAELQRQMGWRVLRGSTESIVVGGDSISVTGFDFPAELLGHSHSTLPDSVDFAPLYTGGRSGGFDITIQHAPQAWDKIVAAGGGDLVVSGHVHSMQLKLTLGGKPWSPAAWLYDNWSGLHTRGTSSLYINDGMGHIMLPVRIGARPEVTLIELKSTRNTPAQ